MDEADRVAHKIAIIDHGKLVAQDTPQGLKTQTGASTLEDAYLALTGSTMRDESTNVGTDQMRQFAKMWGNRR
jgi:ABC-2 type transport system ATP-binding protein